MAVEINQELAIPGGPTTDEVDGYVTDLQEASWAYVRTLIANGRIGGAYRELMTSFENQCRVAGLPFAPEPGVVPTCMSRLIADKRMRDAARRAGGAK